MTRAIRRGLAVAIVLFGATLGRAQTTTGEILGTVTDASGAVVPGAEVTLLRVATGERRQTKTDASQPHQKKASANQVWPKSYGFA